MRLSPKLLALLPAALLGLTTTACDRTSANALTSPDRGLQGGFAFSLDSLTFATAKPWADSLRVELRQGTQLRAVSASLDGSVRIQGLENGPWIVSAGLYSKDGALKYFGSDTVLVSAGQVAQSDLVLRPAKGSVNVTIRIDTTGTGDVVAGSPFGTWILQVAGKDTVYANRYDLSLDSTGTFSGTDGCNTVFGSWGGQDGSFRAKGTTKMACLLNPIGQLDLWAARSWKLDTAGNDRHLLLQDSLGRTVAVYGTYVLHPTGLLVPDADQVTFLDTVDTAAIPNRVPVSLLSSTLTDSGLLLSVMLPHPGVKVRFVALPQRDSATLCTMPYLVDTLGSTQAPPECHTVALPQGPRSYLVTGEVNPALSSIQVLTPATVLVKGFVPDLCSDHLGGYSIQDGFGKALSFMAQCQTVYPVD